MGTTVTFPDGTRMTGGRIADAVADARTAPPDLGLYAHRSDRPRPTMLGRLVNGVLGRPIHAGSWMPHWSVTWIQWPDMGIPSDGVAAAAAIETAFERARAGQRVEVRCLGGRGRTGTMLACMAVMAGVPADQAVDWVRTTYARGAVERQAQVEWVAWFAARRTDTIPD